jgi:predicted regulator of Ras-like GTPase activity (Roadblock/LC7/MglB family)
MVAQNVQHPMAKIEAQAADLLHPKGPQSVLICSLSGLPVLHVSRVKTSVDQDEVAAWLAELAAGLFDAARVVMGETPSRAELRSQSKALLLLRDDPFVVAVEFPPASGKPLGGSRSQDLQKLIDALHEELN